MSKLTPVLKWAGGKRQLLTKILPLIPDDYNRYFEPFVGAGAVLFELQPKKAVINDANEELINVYCVIRDNPDELIKALKKHEKNHNKEYYYKVRDVDRQKKYDRMTEVEKAARIIYLNRTCYNGLYRVNRAGYFNTPIGYNSSVTILNENSIRGISEYLNTADIEFRTGDYSFGVRYTKKNDFVFLDPPYYPVGKDYFLRYGNNPFGIEEQLKLKKKCDDFTKRGIRFIETNSDCEEIRELYSEYIIEEVDVRRSINSIANNRTGKELVIRNY